jgi:hypothetical protein
VLPQQELVSVQQHQLEDQQLEQVSEPQHQLVESQILQDSVDSQV